MFSVLTALLLAGAEPSSNGFLTYGISSPLHGDTSRGYATNVVHLHVNDSTSTSMNVELLCLRMDYHVPARLAHPRWPTRPAHDLTAPYAA